MDLRAITDLEGGRLQSDVGSPTAPWDPGVPVPVPQHQVPAPAPAPPSTPADGYVRHKDRGGSIYRAPQSKRSDGAVSSDHIDRDGEDESNLPFVPHRVSPGPRFHHPSSPHATHPVHKAAVHAPSRATHIATHPTRRVDSDRDCSTAISTAGASTPMAWRRARPHEDDEDGDGIEERERYRSRPRRHSTEPDISLKPCAPHSPPTLIPRHCSPPSALSPASDGASSRSPSITELASIASPRRDLARDVDRDEPDHSRRCDGTEAQWSPLARGEGHALGQNLAHPQAAGLAEARSSSIESAEEWDQNPVPPQAAPHQPAHEKTNMPPVSPASASASQPAPDPGSMLSDSELGDETVHLRALLGCPPGAPVGLDALADPPPGEKPNYPLPTLIKLAIYGSPRRRLTLQEIYQALEDRFEWFRQRTDELSWKNSIRHNLSLRKCFLKVQRPITEPGKGSYWMIDLTQGEGNKRVRKRNKKPTKGQLAAQAAAEAYRASARLPGQGDGHRPPPYPMPAHEHPQQRIAEDLTDDECQASPMQTNFTPVTPPEASHHALPRTSTSQQSQPLGIVSPHQRQHPEQLYSAAIDHTSSSLHQGPAQPLPPSHNILGFDTNIDPALRVLSKDGLGPHAITGPIAASRYDILPQRGGPTPSTQPGAVQLPIPLNMPLMGAAPRPRGQSVTGTPQTQQQGPLNHQTQMTLPHPSFAPSQSTYHPQLFSHQGTGLRTSQAISMSQFVQHPPSSLPLQQQLQASSTLPQPDTPRQMAMAIPQHPALTLTQAQLPTRLPPMRTLSESPAPASSSSPSSSQLASSLSSSSISSPPQPLQDPTAGFARFAAHVPTGFAKPTFGKPALDVVNPLIIPTRPLLLLPEDKDKGTRGSGGGGGGSGSSQRQRHFARPPPRSGIEYLQRPDGGLVTARRTDERHDEEGTVEWINRLDRREENRGGLTDAGAPRSQEDMF